MFPACWLCGVKLKIKAAVTAKVFGKNEAFSHDPTDVSIRYVSMLCNAV